MTARVDQVVRSGLYNLGGSIGIKVLQFARAVIVARLLAPAELGRFALVAVALGVVEAVTDPGLVAAVVQARSVDVKGLRTVWTANLVRGCVIAGSIAAAAPGIASLLGEPDLTTLIRAVALVSALRPLASLSLILRVRDVDLVPTVRVQLGAEVVETVVAIAAVAAAPSAWGLVAARLAGCAVEVAGSYLVPGFAPRLRLAWAELRGPLRFGRWMFLSKVLTYASTSGDDLAVGRFAGTASLGLYRVSYRLASLPTTEVTQTIGRATFPAFARAHHASPEAATAAFKRTLVLTAGLAAPIAALLVVTARDLVQVLLGPAWAGAVVPLAILAPAGFGRALVETGWPLFTGVGKPHLDTAINVVRTLVLFAGLAFLIGRWGASGAAVASLLSVAATIPAWAAGLTRVGLPLRPTAAAVLKRLPAAAVAGVAGWLSASFAPGPVASLALAGAAGAGAWLAAVRVFDPVLATEMRSLLGTVRSLWAARVERRRPAPGRAAP